MYSFPYSIVARIAACIMLILTAAGVEGRGYRAYGWFIDLRWAVCAAAIWSAIVAGKARRPLEAIILAVIAIVYNPLVKVTMSRTAWHPVDILCVVLLVLSCIWAREKPTDKPFAVATSGK